MDKKSYMMGQMDVIGKITSIVDKFESNQMDDVSHLLSELKDIKPMNPSVELDHEGDLLARINDNLYIHYIEVNNSHSGDDEDEEVVSMLEISCNFHGKHCTAYISPERLDDEVSGSYASLETSSSDNIHDSFTEVMEEDEWDKIREACIKWLVDGRYSSDCDAANKRLMDKLSN